MPSRHPGRRPRPSSRPRRPRWLAGPSGSTAREQWRQIDGEPTSARSTTLGDHGDMTAPRWQTAAGGLLGLLLYGSLVACGSTPAGSSPPPTAPTQLPTPKPVTPPTPTPGTTLPSAGQLTASSSSSIPPTSSGSAPTTEPPPAGRIVDLTPHRCRSGQLDLTTVAAQPGHYRACIRRGSVVVLRLAPPFAGPWAPLSAQPTAVVAISQHTHTPSRVLTAQLVASETGTVDLNTTSTFTGHLGRPPSEIWRLDLRIVA